MNDITIVWDEKVEAFNNLIDTLEKRGLDIEELKNFKSQLDDYENKLLGWYLIYKKIECC